MSFFCQWFCESKEFIIYSYNFLVLGNFAVECFPMVRNTDLWRFHTLPLKQAITCTNWNTYNVHNFLAWLKGLPGRGRGQPMAPNSTTLQRKLGAVSIQWEQQCHFLAFSNVFLKFFNFWGEYDLVMIYIVISLIPSELENFLKYILVIRV